MLTQKRLKDLLSYDPDTGVFMRKVSRRGRNCAAGTEPGSIGNDGYRKIGIDMNRYVAHRLAWLYVHGEFPNQELDHINGMRDDNRICNLREATKSQNQQNQKMSHADSLSGYLGVTRNNKSGKWQAKIKANGTQKAIGLFNCPTAAYLLGYLPAKRQLHEFGTL